VQHSSAVPTDDEPDDLHAASFTSAAVEPQLTTANRQTGDDNDIHSLSFFVVTVCNRSEKLLKDLGPFVKHSA